MTLRYKFIFLFAGLSLLGNAVLFSVTYDSVKNYKIQQAQRSVATFATHLSEVLSRQSNGKGFERDQLNQLDDILPHNYVPILVRNGVFMLPNQNPPSWVRATLFSPKFLDAYRLSQAHKYLQTDIGMLIWDRVPIPGESRQLLVLHKPRASIWQDYQDVFMLPMAITGVLTTWAAIWMAIILSSLYSKLEKKNLLLSQQKQTIEDSLDSLNQINTAKSQFLANMSHEIRTPLTAIIGFADTSLDHEQSQQESDKAFATIKNCGEHLLQVINEVLDISKIEAGKLGVDSDEINLFQIIQEVDAVYRQQAKNKGITFSVHYHFPLPEVIFGDAYRLRQILFNLCDNALKFTDRGHITLEISCDARTQFLAIDVTDTGIGLSAEQQSNIFDSFTQADSSTTRKYGGSGLGLTLSRQLAELLGGTLSVRSEPGMGSCFQLRVKTGPLNKTNFIGSEAQIPGIDKHQSMQDDLFQTRQQILVAEDNPDNQRLISIYLNKISADHKIVKNGALALEHLQYHPVDLVLLDIQMPVMDGFTALKYIRTNHKHLPVIALTANTLAEDKQRCLAAGFTDFIAKPIQRRAFYDTLAKYLKAIEHEQPDSRIYSSLVDDELDFTEAIQHFIITLPQQRRDILNAFQHQDWPTFSSLIHKIKGAAGGVGFPYLTELATQIEAALKHNDLTKIGSLLEEVERYCARIDSGPFLEKRASLY